MIVADTNLVAYFVSTTAHSDVAESVWARDHEWVVPPLWLPELRSMFGVAMRRGMCTLDEAVAAIERALSIVVEHAESVPSRAVLELSRDSKCSTYDCEFVALAVALGVPLVTSDRAVLRAFPKVAVSPADFAAARP